MSRDNCYVLSNGATIVPVETFYPTALNGNYNWLLAKAYYLGEMLVLNLIVDQENNLVEPAFNLLHHSSRTLYLFSITTNGCLTLGEPLYHDDVHIQTLLHQLQICKDQNNQYTLITIEKPKLLVRSK